MIGDRIKEIREKNGLTQSELARRLGLTRSGVNAWEMGVSIPSAQYLIGLANLFRVSTDYLLGLDRREGVDISNLDGEEKAVIYSLLNYFEKDRHSVRLSDSELAQLEDEYTVLVNSGDRLPRQMLKVVKGILDGEAGNEP